MTARGEAFAVRAPGFFGNRVAEWAPGASATAGQVLGWTFTFGGTSTMQVMTNAASLLAQLPRLRFTAIAGASHNAGLVPDQTTCWRGNAAALGGFHFATRFSLTANVSNSRCFVGLSAQLATLCGAAEPTTVNDTIGVGFVSTDLNTATWRFIARDGATSMSVPITGATRNVTDVYELSILCAPNASTMIVRFVNLTTTAVLIDDVEYGLAAGDHIPRNTSFLSAHVEVGTASSGGLPSIDLASMFLDVPDGARAWPGVLGRDGIYNVRDFGAIGDGTTPDDAAFASALRAMGMSGGGTLLVPGGTYKLVNDLLISLIASGTLLLKGVAPGSGASKSQLLFAAYKGIRIVGPKTGTVPANAAAVEDLDILGGHFAGSGLRPPEHPVWTASTNYAPGTQVVVPGRARPTRTPRSSTGTRTCDRSRATAGARSRRCSRASRRHRSLIPRRCGPRARSTTWATPCARLAPRTSSRSSSVSPQAPRVARPQGGSTRAA